jgi:hypothetical protein
LVLKFPTAVLATGVMPLAFLSFFCGLILDTGTCGDSSAGTDPVTALYLHNSLDYNTGDPVM